MTNLNPQAGFTFTRFGAVAEAETIKSVAIDPANRTDFDNAAQWFRSQANNRYLPLTLPTVEEAEEYRAQLVAYGILTGYHVALPKYAPAHDNTVTDKDTGRTTVKHVPANKVPRHWNKGTDVHFRIVIPSPKETPAVDTKTVTVSQGTPKPAAPQSRGHQILAK